MRTNIVIDDELVREGLKRSGIRTKRELVDLALREFVERRRRRDLLELKGQGGIDDQYDHKALRERGGQQG